MKNLKKIKLKEGDQVLDDLQLKKIVGGTYVDPNPGGGGGVGREQYCKTLRCGTYSIGPGQWITECWGPCRCGNGAGAPCTAV